MILFRRKELKMKVLDPPTQKLIDEYIIKYDAREKINKLNMQLRMACFTGDYDQIINAIDQGADIKVDDNYPIRIASFAGHLKIVEKLVEMGGNIHVQDDFCLRHAMYNNNKSLIKILLKNKANVNADQYYGIKYYSGIGDLEMVQLFIKYSSPANADNDYPIGIAKLNGHENVVEFLASQGGRLMESEVYKIYIERKSREIC
jgi:ankyrin repeat protein